MILVCRICLVLVLMIPIRCSSPFSGPNNIEKCQTGYVCDLVDVVNWVDGVRYCCLHSNVIRTRANKNRQRCECVDTPLPFYSTGNLFDGVNWLRKWNNIIDMKNIFTALPFF